MFELNISPKGFVEVLSETFRNPSPDEVLSRIASIDQEVKMGHSRVEATKIIFDQDLGAWVCDTPEGFVLLTHNAHQQLAARQRTTGKGGVVGFTMAKTDKGPVALGTGSDKYGYIPFGEVAERVNRLMVSKNMNHTPREMTVSPSFVRVLYEVERTEVAGDTILLGWGWQTSHDGTSSLRVFDRVEREVCSNGMRGTVNDVILKLRHVWGGMLYGHRTQLRRSNDLALPEKIVNYLANNSQRKMKLKADESILAAIDRQIDSGRATIAKARELADMTYWDEGQAWTVTRNILKWISDEDQDKTLRDVLGLRQDLFKALKQYGRERWLLETVKDNLRKYGENIGYSAWSIVQALNDRRSLDRGKFPLSLADAMETLSNSVLTNWEQVAEAVRPIPT